MVHPLFLPFALFAATSSRYGSTAVTRKLFSTTTTTTLQSAASAIGPLLDSKGVELSEDALQETLKSKRVALYFTAGWCPMCTSFEPSLVKFRDAASDSGKPIELIYVSSDRSEPDQQNRAGKLDMLSVPFGDKASQLKKQYKVWSGSESLQFGVLGRRSGVPALIVLDKRGDELAFLPAESQGVKALSLWPIDDENGVWGEEK